VLRVPLILFLLALLAHLIGIARGPQLARYYNITARAMVCVGIIELFWPWLRH